MAREALMSPAHFSRSFKAAFGEPPYAYLQSVRVERAMALLREPGASVTDVCLEVGCTSLGSFSSSFTRITGVTPSAYRDGDHAALAPVLPCVVRRFTRPARAR